MHTFQPYPIDMLDINPFTKLSKEWALVTAGDKEKSNTMTVSWGGTGVLWGKNVVFIFIRESRYTKDFIDNGEFFSLSFLSEKYRDALKYCGAHSGRGEDKWSKAGLTPATRHGIPYPDEANLVFLCRKMAAVPIEEASFTDKAIMHQWYGDHGGWRRCCGDGRRGDAVGLRQPDVHADGGLQRYPVVHVYGDLGWRNRDGDGQHDGVVGQ